MGGQLHAECDVIYCGILMERTCFGSCTLIISYKPFRIGDLGMSQLRQLYNP